LLQGVVCEIENDKGIANVVSAAGASVAGNILFEGIIDHNSGAAYEYPTLI
jgi:hypothetical protein